MNKSLVLKNKIHLFFLLLISFFIFIYFLYFLINGPRGIISFYKIKNQNFVHHQKLSNLEKKNLILINRINRLQTNSIDIDFLDQKIREKTGYLKNNEVLITFDQ